MKKLILILTIFTVSLLSPLAHSAIPWEPAGWKAEELGVPLKTYGIGKYGDSHIIVTAVKNKDVTTFIEDDLIYSTDYGDTWTRVKLNTRTKSVGVLNDIVYYSNDVYTVFTKVGDFTNWDTLRLPLVCQGAYAFANYEDKLFYANNAIYAFSDKIDIGYYKSVNGGKSWQIILYDKFKFPYSIVDIALYDDNHIVFIAVDSEKKFSIMGTPIDNINEYEDVSKDFPEVFEHFQPKYLAADKNIIIATGGVIGKDDDDFRPNYVLSQDQGKTWYRILTKEEGKNNYDFPFKYNDLKSFNVDLRGTKPFAFADSLYVVPVIFASAHNPKQFLGSINSKTKLPLLSGDDEIVKPGFLKYPGFQTAGDYIISKSIHNFSDHDGGSFQRVKISEFLKLLQSSNVQTGSGKVINSKELQIFPNPAQTHILVKLDNEIDYTFEVISNDGKVMKQGKLINNKIDISNLATGAYILKVSNGDESYSGKFAKE